MDKNIAHLLDRLRELKGYGYDVLGERDFALRKAGLKKTEKILEIGTGRGYMALALAQKGFSLTTIDNDRKTQQDARRLLKYYRAGKRVRLRIMNAEKLRFRDGSFDCVLAVNFMHHARNPVACLKEMVRLAKEKVAVVDVNKRGERILEKMHARQGHAHQRSKIGFARIRQVFGRAKMKVKTYRSRCQNIIIAKKE
ncbi:MAG: class I SAM-dependent methyltransferase [Candidatus Omnitrophica bacterium]|nr:class I SAM-dependent methyltransferase [Candidatus Omnitrophota bacterium]